MRTTDTTARPEVRPDGVVVIGRSASGQPRTYRLVRSSRTRSIVSAYRHLLIVLLGLDPHTLSSELRAQRASRAKSALGAARALKRERRPLAGGSWHGYDVCAIDGVRCERRDVHAASQ